VVDNKQIKKCGDCAYFGTPKCSYYDDFRKGLIKPKDKGCDDFFSKPKKEKVKYVAKPTVLTDEFLAEQIWDRRGLPKYAVYYFNEDRFEFVDELDLGEEDDKGRKIIYKPVFNDHLKKGMVILPRKPVECTIGEVIEEAMEFVFGGFDPCGKNNELKILILIAITSWILDKEKPLVPIAGIGVFAPIIGIRGPSGSGKNRLANLLRFLTYHPFFDVSTYRIPSLYRPLDIWKGTLVMDEADMRNTGETSILIHFLNSRATGTPIGRQNPDRPSKCDAFESFGITIVTQRRHFDDNATEGRTIPFLCDVMEKSLPTLETEEMIRKGLELQDKLLYIRMKYWKEINIEKTLWIEGVSDPRLNSTLLPVMALAKFSERLKDIVKENIEPLEKARKKLKAQSEDGVIINALWEKIEADLWGIHNNLYYVGAEKQNYKGADGEALELIIPLTTTKLAESTKFSSKKVRKIITSLNIEPDNKPARFRVGRYSYRGIFFEPSKLEKRLREFVVDYEKFELYKVLGLSVPDVPDVPHSPSGEDSTLTRFVKEAPEGKSGTCGTSGTQENPFPQLGDIKDMVWDDSFWGKHECCVCGYEKWTSWKAFLKDGRQVWICDDCQKEWRKLHGW